MSEYTVQVLLTTMFNRKPLEVNSQQLASKEGKITKKKPALRIAAAESLTSSSYWFQLYFARNEAAQEQGMHSRLNLDLR